jgi:hypothetical protein
MTGRDVGMLCNFTLRLQHGREIAQPYRYCGLKIFAPFLSASKIFSASKPCVKLLELDFATHGSNAYSFTVLK